MLAELFAAELPPVDFAVLLPEADFPLAAVDLLAEVLAAVPVDLLVDAFAAEPPVDLLAAVFPAVPADLLEEAFFAAGFAAVLLAEDFAAVLSEVDLLPVDDAALVGAAFLVVDAALVGAVFVVALVGAFLVAIRFSPNWVNLVNLECLLTLASHPHKTPMLLECYE